MKLLWPAGIVANALILIGMIHSRAWKRTPFLFWLELASYVFIGIQFHADYWTWQYFYAVGIAQNFLTATALMTYPKAPLAEWLPPCYFGIGGLQLYRVCLGFEGGRYSLLLILYGVGICTAFLLAYCLWNGYIGPRGIRYASYE